MAEITQRKTRRPILLLVGLLMAAIVALGIAGMISSMVIASVTQGMAAAVNQSGTLRMQSYRVGVALADDSVVRDERRRRVGHLSREFEQRLISPRLTGALPSAANDPVRLAYERVSWRWFHEMRHAIDAFVEEADEEAARAVYLGGVDDFVVDIHSLVRVLEERAERRIDMLRLIQAIALVLTVAIVVVTMIIVHRRLATPLGELLVVADRARRGDFSARTRFVGSDELGRLGGAMNLMTEGLSQIYNELEERISEKTRDLARTNRSLELLYETSRSLEESPITEPVLRRVLEQVRARLKLAQLALCLREGQPDDITRGACIGASMEGSQPHRPDGGGRHTPCALCAAPEMPAGGASADPARANPAGAATLSFPVRDRERRLGMLCAVPYPGQVPEDWQRPLLESLATHFAKALSLNARMRESRRLVLHEERSILARELHDSLAQSLSYLKIQAARLDAALSAPSTEAGRATPPEIVAELRDGISSAYRQLRELLTTFRLKIDGRGLGSALADTIEEFRYRSDLELVLDDRVTSGLMSPNEEVHVLQIVREALSNVVRHARARRCSVTLQEHGGRVEVRVDDDGTGLAVVGARRGHYGITIMRERSTSLGGELSVRSKPGEGTEISVSFRPRAASGSGPGTGGSRPSTGGQTRDQEHA
ncbi:MAG: type IV pili methyl-accepting chemotaxis transducer N-terminal domain-containing protein [Thiohalocapsa sp.]|nr:type IV pili methyl-accepting chemotaxis transducer N-terminal domain-containing protein [Thiohalocapsa sp.]